MVSNNAGYINFNKLDASICVGVSYKFTDKFDATFRVNVGMTKIHEKFSNKNSVGQLGIGYRF